MIFGVLKKLIDLKENFPIYDKSFPYPFHCEDCRYFLKPRVTEICNLVNKNCVDIPSCPLLFYDMDLKRYRLKSPQDRYFRKKELLFRYL